MDNYRPFNLHPSGHIQSDLKRCTWIIIHITEKQFDFRWGSSIEHAVTYLTDNKRENMDKSHMTAAVFMNLRKAFHTVDHACLLSKFKYYGIEGIKEAGSFES